MHSCVAWLWFSITEKETRIIFDFMQAAAVIELLLSVYLLK